MPVPRRVPGPGDACFRGGAWFGEVPAPRGNACSGGCLLGGRGYLVEAPPGRHPTGMDLV